jgi:hypothetical protein
VRKWLQISDILKRGDGLHAEGAKWDWKCPSVLDGCKSMTMCAELAHFVNIIFEQR